MCRNICKACNPSYSFLTKISLYFPPSPPLSLFPPSLGSDGAHMFEEVHLPAISRRIRKCVGSSSVLQKASEEGAVPFYSPKKIFGLISGPEFAVKKCCGSFLIVCLIDFHVWSFPALEEVSSFVWFFISQLRSQPNSNSR